MKEMIKVQQLTKSYGSSAVLKGINMTVQEGEVFGLVGHNGAGKSTFIHTLTGIVNKSGGSFEILQTADNKLNKVKQQIGVMPDISNLYEHMRGISFLMYMGSLVGDKKNKEDYVDLMKDVGLEGAENKKIKSYSYGMKKKISIVQSLLGNTDLLILDEPTSGLDPESAIHIRDLIANLQRSGKTILLTSHNLDEIDRISDRVGILSEGIIKKSGTPNQLKQGIESEVTISVRTAPDLQQAFVRQLEHKLEEDIRFIGKENGYIQLQLAMEENIPALSQLLIASDYKLYEIKVEQSSLEDVFMNT